MPWQLRFAIPQWTKFARTISIYQVLNLSVNKTFIENKKHKITFLGHFENDKLLVNAGLLILCCTKKKQLVFIFYQYVRCKSSQRINDTFSFWIWYTTCRVSVYRKRNTWELANSWPQQKLICVTHKIPWHFNMHKVIIMCWWLIFSTFLSLHLSQSFQGLKSKTKKFVYTLFLSTSFRNCAYI